VLKKRESVWLILTFWMPNVPYSAACGGFCYLAFNSPEFNIREFNATALKAQLFNYESSTLSA
jgi:hypothetical protein